MLHDLVLLAKKYLDHVFLHFFLICFFGVHVFISACLKLRNANSPLFEEFLQAIAATLLSSQSARDFHSASAVWTPQRSLPLKTCAEILIRLLEDSVSGQSSDHLASGLLVDWCEIIDPEIVQLHPLIQRQLLFRDKLNMSSWDRSLTIGDRRSPSAYLLGLMTHQACWETLQDCLDWLLGHDGEENRYKPEKTRIALFIDEQLLSICKTRWGNVKSFFQLCFVGDYFCPFTCILLAEFKSCFISHSLCVSNLIYYFLFFIKMGSNYEY